MTAVRREFKRRRRFVAFYTTLAVMALGLVLALPAMANHPEASLAGSNFEIDIDANLKVNDAAPPSLDWANVNEIRATDAVNGTGDDSYAGGVKEATVCPGETTDSIPPNKSDLLSFHVYREAGTGTHPGFLNLAWSRVSEPEGTTLMDFEFNQSSTPCSSGPNVVRTAGDLLLEYSIDQGGSRADITARTWTGTAWSAPADLDVPSATCGNAPCAAGTINTSSIPATESDGLIASGSKEPRTFGEAQLDLRLLFQPNKCASFGSAMLKSRSSDSFTSQLKDFVAPVPINLQNCGQVIIRKQTTPDEDPNVTEFGYTKSFGTDPVSANTFKLTDDGVKDYGKTVLFGSGYTVTEDVIPANWEFVSLDCSASSASTSFTTNGATVTFAIDADTDKLDCTYTNVQLLGAIDIEKLRKHAASGTGNHPHAGVTFVVTGGDLPAAGISVVTDANGHACVSGLKLSSVSGIGNYTVHENVPSGYHLSGLNDRSVAVNATSAGCGAELPLPASPDTDVQFVNIPLTNITVSVDSQVDGGTASTIDCDDDATDDPVETGANGDGSKNVNNLEPGTYVCTLVVDP